MLFKRVFLALIVCFLLINKSYSQTLKSIAIIEKQTQDCLDKGIGMMACSATYEDQMDSLLNLAYNTLRKKLSQAGKDSLKAEEIDWIKKRDKQFKIIAKEETKELGDGQDGLMATYHSEGDFIKERVIVLIKRLNKLNK